MIVTDDVLGQERPRQPEAVSVRESKQAGAARQVPRQIGDRFIEIWGFHLSDDRQPLRTKRTR